MIRLLGKEKTIGEDGGGGDPIVNGVYILFDCIGSACNALGIVGV